MAILSRYRQDSNAINNGEWVLVGDEFEDLEIQSRGLTDQYFDAMASKLNRSARAYGGNQERIPSAIRRRITAECLVSHVFMDVRNLWHDEEKQHPVSKEEFIGLLMDPDYAELLIAVMRAAGRVGQQRAEALEEALGNLRKPSEPSSPDPQG